MFDYEYIGNLHVHSHYSDGGGSISRIVEAGYKAGLDFICINDHDFLTEDLHLSEEGFYGKLLVLLGLEIGEGANHYLGFGLKHMIRGDGLGPQEIIDQVNNQGGLGFLAHPFEKGMPLVEKSRAYRWNDFSVTGFTGISIWNFSSRWKERVKTIFHGLYCLLFKSQSLLGPSRETLSYWDALCQERQVPAIGGSDAHSALFKRWGLNFVPLTYDFLLGSINIHILLHRPIPNDLELAKKDIYGAMEAGRLFIAHDALCPSRGFRFIFISNDGSDLVLGEEGEFQPGELVIELPNEGEIRLYRDGEKIFSHRGMEAVYRIKQKGVYRVAVYRHLRFFGWRPWIFSNPIYLR